MEQLVEDYKFLHEGLKAQQELFNDHIDNVILILENTILTIDTLTLKKLKFPKSKLNHIVYNHIY